MITPSSKEGTVCPGRELCNRGCAKPRHTFRRRPQRTPPTLGPFFYSSFHRLVWLGACLDSRFSIPGESDSTLGHEQVFSPLEYRSDAASAAECAGLRSKRPCLAVYRRVGAGEPRSQGDHGQLCERARAAAV